MRRRWIILLIGLPAYAFVLMVVATTMLGVIAVEDWTAFNWRDAPAAFVDMVTTPAWWGYFGPSALVMIALQALFLVPMFTRRPPRDLRSRSLVFSLLLAAFFAGLLTMGLGTAVMELIALVALPASKFDDKDTLWLIPLVMLVVGWVVWSGVLLVFARSIWADRTLGRVVGIMLAGTLLEVLVVVPIDVMVRRRTDCYCATGTFCTLCLAGIATLWLAGPGVVIAITSRRHRLWRERHCPDCGYPRGPTPGACCPECGFAWDLVRGSARRPGSEVITRNAGAAESGAGGNDAGGPAATGPEKGD